MSKSIELESNRAQLISVIVLVRLLYLFTSRCLIFDFNKSRLLISSP